MFGRWHLFRGPAPPDEPSTPDTPRTLIELFSEASKNPLQACLLVAMCWAMAAPFLVGLDLVIEAAKSLHPSNFSVFVPVGTFTGGSGLTFAAISVVRRLRSGKPSAASGEDQASRR